MIYIQSDSDKKMPHHFDCACALYGTIESALDYMLITMEEVSSGKFDNLIRRNLFVGSVEFMTEVFKRIGISNVRLPENSNRESSIITLKEAHQRVSLGEKLFVKPLEIKLFTGLVLDGMTYTCLKNLPDETMLISYSPFESKIESEWRIYVHNHKMIDSRNYSGEFKISPDYNYIEGVILSNKDRFPQSYVIDIGILKNEKNVVIEYNDMWAIGNYGIPNDIYLRMLKDRYFEIIKQ